TRRSSDLSLASCKIYQSINRVPLLLIQSQNLLDTHVLPFVDGNTVPRPPSIRFKLLERIFFPLNGKRRRLGGGFPVDLESFFKHPNNGVGVPITLVV